LCGFSFFSFTEVSVISFPKALSLTSVESIGAGGFETSFKGGLFNVESVLPCPSCPVALSSGDWHAAIKNKMSVVNKNDRICFINYILLNNLKPSYIWQTAGRIIATSVF
jgi:hypothetical protein